MNESAYSVYTVSWVWGACGVVYLMAHPLLGVITYSLGLMILKINLSGRFTLNIIDELVIVHHRNSYSSLVFDIRIPGEFDGGRATRKGPSQIGATSL